MMSASLPGIRSQWRLTDVSGPDPGAVDPFLNNPALEQTIRRILDEHLELAWQEIKLAIQRDLNKP